MREHHLLTGCAAFAMGAIYSMILIRLEAAFPIKPDWIWLEVVIGVIIVLGTVSIARRVHNVTDATVLEEMIVAGFVGTGIPIILWQILLMLNIM